MLDELQCRLRHLLLCLHAICKGDFRMLATSHSAAGKMPGHNFHIRRNGQTVLPSEVKYPKHTVGYVVSSVVAKRQSLTNSWMNGLKWIKGQSTNVRIEVKWFCVWNWLWIPVLSLAGCYRLMQVRWGDQTQYPMIVVASLCAVPQSCRTLDCMLLAVYTHTWPLNMRGRSVNEAEPQTAYSFYLRNWPKKPA